MTRIPRVSQTMRELADSSQSSAIDAAAGEWERNHRLLTEFREPAYVFAGALDAAADAVYAQKLVIIGAAAALAAEFTATQLGAVLTLGADEAAVPAEIISTRAVVKFALEELTGTILGKLINVAATEITDHLSRTISGMLAGTLQAGAEVQSLALTPEAVTGVSRKLTGQASAVRETGIRAHTENTSRSIEDASGVGGWREVTGALERMLLEIAEGLFKNLPAAISRVLGDIAEFLLRFAERVKAADDDAEISVPRDGPDARLAASPDAEINKTIDETLRKVNPKFDPRQSAYSENCTGVVQANELTRRGIPSEAGPLEEPLRKDRGGAGGRSVSAIEDAWGVRFRSGTKADIEQVFKEPGSRGVVYIEWNDDGAHVFNVENVGGKVRFMDGQPIPPVTDASYYFDIGHSTAYVRLDNRPTPPADATRPYLEPG